MKKIIWFRYDLRLEDNQAFNASTKNGEVLPIYIYDENYWRLPTSSSFHLKFIEFVIFFIFILIESNLSLCII